ncbi:hypothetical protein Hanom_Chr03g00189251 [Helianthus anomalus]
MHTVRFSKDVSLKDVCTSSYWCRIGLATSKIFKGIKQHHYRPPPTTTTTTVHVHHPTPPPPSPPV